VGLSKSEVERIERLSPQEKFKCEELTRKFCADLVGGEISKDGGIEGFREYIGGLHPEAQEIIRDHYRWVNAKVVLRGEDETSVIARAVVSCKHKLQTFRPSGQAESDRWSAFGAEIVKMVRDEGWKPPQVLEALEAVRDVMISEGPIDPWIDELRSFGSEWPVQRLDRSWLMPDGSTVTQRFPS
jgi:hypothetical protein